MVLHFLSDAVLLLLRFDFVKELVVIQVKDPVVLDQDLHELVTSQLREDFRKLNNIKQKLLFGK